MAATTGVMVVRMCKVLAMPRSWYMCFSAYIGIAHTYLAHICELSSPEAP